MASLLFNDIGMLQVVAPSASTKLMLAFARESVRLLQHHLTAQLGEVDLVARRG